MKSWSATRSTSIRPELLEQFAAGHPQPDERAGSDSDAHGSCLRLALSAETQHTIMKTLPLKNRAMARKLARGDCIDLKDCPRTVTGDYVVASATFRVDHDYCDSSREVWIWSIALVKRPLPSKMADGSARIIAPDTYLASPTARFHDIDTAAIECVWLR